MKNPSILRWTRGALALCALAMSLSMQAIPAKPGLKRVLTLADGSSVVATLVGDEFGHFWQADDGRTFRELTGQEGTFAPVDAEQVKALAAARRSTVNRRRASRLAPNGSARASSYLGQKKCLIILAQFTDVKFKTSNNLALWKRIANEENFSYGNFKGSMRDYFLAQSDGQFEIDFDVVGPYTVSKNMAYYGANDSEAQDEHPAQMVCEACRLADQDVDFSDYDWDGDGYVDQVYVVYAGKGEADGGSANTIWPHAWDLASGGYYGDGDGVLTLDGVKVNTYACGAELDGASGSVAGIGTMCHEFSHCLGYPDFYDTDYSGGQGMGRWDLMDQGSYNGDGYQPAGYTSYERWVAGWKEPVVLEKNTTVAAMKALQDGGDFYIIYNKGNNNEYYLLENRQKTAWDASLPGEGLLILHVDYKASAWNNNTPNDDPSHQRMTWVAADNQYQYYTYQGTKYYTELGMRNDPFPYGSVNAFGKNTTPAAKFYNRNSDGTYYMDSSVEDITQNSDGTVAFRFRGTTTVATPTFSPEEGTFDEAQRVSISCDTEGATIYYTTNGAMPTAESEVYVSPIQVVNTTTLKAVAVVDGEESDVATATFTINSKQDEESTGQVRYVLVNSTAQLADGDEVVVVGVNDGKYYAMASSRNNYRGSVEVTASADGKVVTPNDQTQLVTLEKTGSSWHLKTGSGYLYAASSRYDYMRTGSVVDPDGNADAAISVSGDLATVEFQGDHTHCSLRYDASWGSPTFSCYLPSSSLPKLRLYRKTLAVRGDANGDGVVTVADVTLTINYLCGEDANGFVFDNAEVSGDGIISVADVVGIINILLGQ